MKARTTAALIDADRLEMAVPAFLRRASGRTALVCMGLRRPAKAGRLGRLRHQAVLDEGSLHAMDEALGRPKGARASEAEPLG